ncbi:MAG: OB-fold nucleic acid binding domain-containing protein [Candidatus Nanoarchaeia archaeon]|nr:OB-fold nucleic acid binding domain-containing protein [Candidatus Haiyanarchaeum thermophilum]MCW1303062.1 OB-fold nucleic acid binding domain-containing protein [Candidatus Haiyanarchaeum thermophilum]MCW1303727.1 OB-fold nucleic acid binding domain-containing protein [Candidatus Haiyanarchaeum thermophilum]MCW1306828.1 OB-fold nucleic acid binding domain-containing protein [Candidatus Haiyanarchaeum thermophilum]MCW1307070.1 OB-fold nucleic acid binding domain-containing protein [Candidat
MLEKLKRAFIEKEIGEIDPDRDNLVSFFGTVVNIDETSSSIIVDDSKARATVVIKDENTLKELKVGELVRVMGAVIKHEEGFEVIAELVQHMDGMNRKLLQEYLELRKRFKISMC